MVLWADRGLVVKGLPYLTLFKVHNHFLLYFLQQTILIHQGLNIPPEAVLGVRGVLRARLRGRVPRRQDAPARLPLQQLQGPPLPGG